MIDGELCETITNNIRNTKKSTKSKFICFVRLNTTPDTRYIGRHCSRSLLRNVQLRINHVRPGADFSSARLCSR